MTTTSRAAARPVARDIGKLRLEGKEYIVADGDVLHFRFAT
jgi:ribosome-binding ATPase YchF (GTP1/OBG family)